MNTASPSSTVADAVRQRSDRLIGAIEAKSRVCEASVGELRRQHHALARRRGGGKGPDASRYALGHVLAMVGAEDVSDTALLGLLANPDEMLAWLGEARRAGAGPMVGDLVRAVFADEARCGWCEQWGRILQWRHRAALYHRAVRSFVDSGRTGPAEQWRRKDVTDDQAALIATLVGIIGEPAPAVLTRGEAFDWIYARGGNPRYWREPAPLPAVETGNG